MGGKEISWGYINFRRVSKWFQERYRLRTMTHAARFESLSLDYDQEFKAAIVAYFLSVELCFAAIETVKLFLCSLIFEYFSMFKFQTRYP